MKEVLVTGASGLVGSKFVELYGERYNLTTPGHSEFDMTDPDSVKKFFSGKSPDVLVNFAAYTNVSEAENQRGNKQGDCWRINVDGVRNLLLALPDGCRLIQISTDYVFPGSEEFRGPYAEDAVPETVSSRLTWYGFTKAEAERAIISALGERSAILRLIYPVSAKYDKKLDYLRKSLDLYDHDKLYPMFSDQWVSITLVDKVAEAVSRIIDQRKYGIFHASSEDTGTPQQIISYLLEKARGVKNAVKASTLDEFLKKVDNPARYPKFGGLRVEETESALGIKYGTWKDMVDEVVRQMGKTL